MPSDNGGYAAGESWQTGSSLKQANMQVFVDWLLVPAELREPRTRQGLADMLGVTTQTLRNYEREPFVSKTLMKARRDAVKVSRVGDIIDTLVRRATDDEAGAAGNTAAKIVLEWVDKQTSDLSAEALRELPDAELKRMLADMYNRLDA